MSPALVQVKAFSGTSLTALSGTLTSGTGAGNCLAIVVAGEAETTNPTVSGMTLGGSAGNLGVAATAGSGSTNSYATGWLYPNLPSGQTAIAVTLTGGSGTCAYFGWAFEFSGLLVTNTVSAIVDKTATNATSSNSTSWSSGSTAATTAASEVWVGIACGGTTSEPTLTGPSSPWVNEAQQGSSSVDDAAIAGYQITSATGAASYAGTSSASTEYAALVITLLPAVTAAAPVPFISQYNGMF